MPLYAPWSPSRGARRLLAERLAGEAGRIAGVPVDPREPAEAPPPGGPRGAAAWVLGLVLRARRLGSRGEVLGEIAWWASSLVDEREALEYARRPLPPAPRGRPGFWGLAAAALRHAARRRPETAVELVRAAALEAREPCAADAALEGERARLESVMKALGVLLGLTLPLLFVLSALVDPAAALASLAAAAVVWALIRRYGLEFRRVVVESSWRRCAVAEADLPAILEGRDLPSPAEMLGARLPGAGLGGRPGGGADLD